MILAIALIGCEPDIIPADDPRIKPTPDYPCGPARHQCSDKMCCWNGEDCTVDRLPIEADPPGHGYCEDHYGKRRAAARP